MSSGIDLYVKEAGAGPSVLLIHGTGVDADAWGGIFDDLAKDHRVIAYDRRGFSRSKVEPVRDWVIHANDAAAILADRGVESATVAGWSAGGIIAAELAVRHPQRVNALVLLEAPIGGARAVDAAALRALASVSIRRRLRGSDAALDYFMDWLCTSDDGTSVWRTYPKEERRAILANGPAVWKEYAKADSLTSQQLDGIDVPVLVAAGDQTQEWFRRAARRLVRLIPRAELRNIPGANHALGATASEATAAIIREAALRGAAAA